MKRFLIAAVLALAPSLAMAADVAPAVNAAIPVKATPKASFLAPYTGSGLYFGLEAGGGAGSAGVSGVPGVNNAALTTTQGLLGGIVGYSSPLNATRYWFAEGDIGWNNFNGNTAGFSLSGPVTMQFMVGAGMPASEALAVLPTFGLTAPTLPTVAGTTTSNPHIYLAAGVDVSDISADYAGKSGSDWQFSPMVALGLEATLSTGGVIGARVEDVVTQNSVCVGGLCGSQSNLVRAKTYWKF